jgi:NTE family protein
LPPGFPPTRIGDRLYWDGGCVTNTPLEAVLKDQPPGHTVVFMVDLWSASGPPPTTMNEVLWREKQIQYAGRVSSHIDAVVDKVNFRHALRRIKDHAPAEIASAVPDEPALMIGERLDIVHVVYHPTADEIPASDAEFSRASIAARRAAGHRDMLHAINEAPWFSEQKPAHLGALVHRVEKGAVTTRTHPDLRRTTGLRSHSVASASIASGSTKLTA